jgi:hypothetical protein
LRPDGSFAWDSFDFQPAEEAVHRVSGSFERALKRYGFGVSKFVGDPGTTSDEAPTPFLASTSTTLTPGMLKRDFESTLEEKGLVYERLMAWMQGEDQGETEIDFPARLTPVNALRLFEKEKCAASSVPQQASGWYRTATDLERKEHRQRVTAHEKEVEKAFAALSEREREKFHSRARGENRSLRSKIESDFGLVERNEEEYLVERAKSGYQSLNGSLQADVKALLSFCSPPPDRRKTDLSQLLCVWAMHAITPRLAELSHLQMCRLFDAMRMSKELAEEDDWGMGETIMRQLEQMLLLWVDADDVDGGNEDDKEAVQVTGVKHGEGKAVETEQKQGNDAQGLKSISQQLRARNRTLLRAIDAIGCVLQDPDFPEIMSLNETIQNVAIHAGCYGKERRVDSDDEEDGDEEVGRVDAQSAIDCLQTKTWSLAGRREHPVVKAVMRSSAAGMHCLTRKAASMVCERAKQKVFEMAGPEMVFFALGVDARPAARFVGRGFLSGCIMDFNHGNYADWAAMCGLPLSVHDPAAVHAQGDVSTWTIAGEDIHNGNQEEHQRELEEREQERFANQTAAHKRCLAVAASSGDKDGYEVQLRSVMDEIDGFTRGVLEWMDTHPKVVAKTWHQYDGPRQARSGGAGNFAFASAHGDDERQRMQHAMAWIQSQNLGGMGEHEDDDEGGWEDCTDSSGSDY